MKKNLIVALALVFVLGIAGTAFAAANPFVDVPAKHWAYDAVAKLAQAGILDGYGDGTYRGERLATRYEMAQATAKAMARADKADAQMKAMIDKLAVEFAAELNNLGVRVAKLEKNASSIKFWGDSRLRFMSNPSGYPDVNYSFVSNGEYKATAPFTAVANALVFQPYKASKINVTNTKPSGAKYAADSLFDERLRVYAQADLNDKAQFFGRIMSNWTDKSIAGTSAESPLFWDYGYFQWTFNPSMKVAVGRQQIMAGQDLFWTNGGYDAVQFILGAPSDKFTGKIGYGDVSTYSSGGAVKVDQSTRPVVLVDANYKFNKDWTGNAAMYWSTNADKATSATLNTLSQAITYGDGYPFQVYNLGFRGQLNQDFNLRANYFWNTAKLINDIYTNDNHSGWMAELWFKGADKAKVGSWGLAFNYRDIKPFAIDLGNVSGILGNSLTAGATQFFGQKGWGLQGNYTLSKNAVLTATYEKLSYNSSFTTENLLPFYYVQLNVNF